MQYGYSWELMLLQGMQFCYVSTFYDIIQSLTLSKIALVTIQRGLQAWQEQVSE